MDYNFKMQQSLLNLGSVYLWWLTHVQHSECSGNPVCSFPQSRSKMNAEAKSWQETGKIT